MKNMWIVFSILVVNTAFALQTISLSPGSKTVLTVSNPTEVQCEGSASAAVCNPVPSSKNPNFYQIQRGARIEPGEYSSIESMRYEFDKLRKSGLCQ